MLNFFAYTDFLLASGQPVVVGGVPINPAGYDYPADPHDFFADSQHPGHRRFVTVTAPRDRTVDRQEIHERRKTRFPGDVPE